MATETFLKLETAKKNRIQQALLTEFSHYPLAHAQVARIVKDAHIARGAFYKYFTDLTDAYLYLYQTALSEIHQRFALQNVTSVQSAHIYLQEVAIFLDQTSKSPYFDLVKMHLLYNEAFLDNAHFLPEITHCLPWAISTLSHQTIKECIKQPNKQTFLLERLEEVLIKLLVN